MPFKFKQFSVVDTHTAMKIGTDGILLGSWVDLKGDEHILDVGSGCGVIALMAAQKNNQAKITAIEIDDSACIDAHENIFNSPWKDRVTLMNAPLQEFNSDQKWDSIISNPPFFENSMSAKGEERHQARHTDSLHYTDLLFFAQKHLSDNGSLNIILPVENGEACMDVCSDFDLHAQRTCYVKPVPQKEPHRILLSIGKQNIPAEKTTLIIEDGVTRHHYTSAYKEICKDFYLKF